jgi:CRP/FNR family transcriptional regulator, cyclic AMP receptor protein
VDSLNHRRVGAARVEFEWGADTHWNAAPWGSRYRRGLPSVGAREGRDQFCLRSPPACVSLSTPDSDRDVGAMAKSTFPLDSLLTALPADLSSALFAKAHDVSLAADQIVFLAGDAGDGCYRIEDGLLKVSVSAAGGGERILAILGPGSIVGELSMIDGAPRSASVSALRDSKLRFVSRAAFEAFGRSNPDVYRHVMILLARRLRDTNDALAATSFLPVKGRVARALLNLAEAFGRDVGSGRIVLRQKVTQSDLAAMAGIARENVSRILKEWMDRSLVSRLAGYYCLENKAAIEREADLEGDQ